MRTAFLLSNFVRLIVLFVPFLHNYALAGYDLTFSGVHKFDTPLNYSNKSILIAEDGLVEYAGGAAFQNCVIDVNGFLEINSDVNMVDTVINVLGSMEAVKHGIIITENGASSIHAKGDSIKSGKLAIEGVISNPIIVNSDNAASDAEFIIIESESSSDSTLKCIDFYGGWTNIQIYDKKLNEAISNCCFFGAEFPIYQESLDELTDIRFCLFNSNYISIYMAIEGSYGNDISVLLDNIVIDNQFETSYGIVLTASEEVPSFSHITITNSIITNSYCGWWIDADSFYPPIMLNIAYHGNNYNDNLGDSSFQKNPMYLSQSPFVIQSNPYEWQYFIDPNSPVADVNLGYDLWQNSPQQLLTSLHDDFTPRGNKGIGFGIPIPMNYATKVSELTGDIVPDGRVNNRDFAILAADWESDINSAFSVADFDRSGVIDLPDVKVMADNWLLSEMNIKQGNLNGCGPIDFLDFSILAKAWYTDGMDLNKQVSYPDANGYSMADLDYNGEVNLYDLYYLTENWLVTSYIEPNITDSGDYLTLTCHQPSDVNLSEYAIFLDGKYIATRDTVEYPELLIDKQKYQNGIHTIKAVIKGDDAKPYVTATRAILFDTPLSGMSFQEIFDPSQHFVLRGNVADGHTATITIKNLDNNILWSGVYSDDFITLVNPDIFSDDINYTVAYTAADSSGSGPALALGGKPSNRTVGLVICMLSNGMTEGTGITDTGTCRYAVKMMQASAVYPILLRGDGENNQVNYKMFKKVFNKYKKIRYLHIDCHGHYETDGAGFWGFDVLRTRFRFNDGDWPAYNSRIWTDRGLDVPEDYQWLSDDMEKHYCLAHLPFDYDQIRFAVVEACYGLRNIATEDVYGVIHYVEGAYEWEEDNLQNRHYEYPYSDICFALNIQSEKQIVIGSGEAVIKGSIYPYYARFFNALWYGLGSEHLNLDRALNEWALPVASIDVMHEFRIRGAGDKSQIYLRQNP